nr:SprT family zinc-dependent metalloprotease [Nitrosomonas nitrosa]
MRGALRYGDRTIAYNVVAAPTLVGKVRIHVHPNAEVEVEAPAETTGSEISKAVQRRARWISRQLERAAEAQSFRLKREYVSGETHFYIGRRYQLKIELAKKAAEHVRLKAGKIVVVSRTTDPAAIRRRLRNWYLERGAEHFERRLDVVASSVRWLPHPPGLKLIPMKKQWGSCSPDGKIHLNPSLIRAPNDCIDYVIAHEICHLRERNHGKRFYDLLGQAMPNWEHVKARLDGMAELLLAE